MFLQQQENESESWLQGLQASTVPYHPEIDCSVYQLIVYRVLNVLYIYC